MIERAQRFRRRAREGRSTRALWPIALLLALSACTRWNEAPPQLLLLISIDTLRPDHLGAYGYARPTSPTLDAIAAAGVLFEDVTSTSPWTLPAHASLLTWLSPTSSGVDTGGAAIPRDVATLATRLAGDGFATAAVVNGLNLSERHGFERGFEDFLYVRERADQREPSRLITDRALAWLDKPDERRRFLFLHYYDVHSDYASRSEHEGRFADDYAGGFDGSTRQLLEVRHGSRQFAADDVAHLIDLYDAGIRQLDDELARLLAYLDEKGWAERTLLVVTSDHGEEFAEHGSFLHGRTHYQEVLGVPLLLRGPGIPNGVRVATPVSLVDVAPTSLARLGLKVPAGLDGIDLSPLWQRDVQGLDLRVLYAEADHLNAIPDATRSARQGRFKLVLERAKGRHALYDLELDPAETRDVTSLHPDVARHLRDRVELRIGRAVVAPAAPPLDRAESERLRSLGYLD